MKFLRFSDGGRVLCGFTDGEKVFQVESDRYLLEDPEVISEYHMGEVKILPPVSPSKVICVGLNYRDHAAELGMDIPDEPVIFLKPPTAVIGHGDAIVYPAMSSEVDHEVELAAVISERARRVDSGEADEFIAGYTVLNDVTARDLQRRDGQWTRAKSFDTFCPIGPFIETDIRPSNLDISLELNGVLRQSSSTSNMIFTVQELVEFISEIMTLEPGDIIATGTPPGVGEMKPGDTVRATVEGVGTLENRVESSDNIQ